MATTAATAAPAYKPTDEADAAELAADAGAGAPIELGKRMATRARPATVAPGLLLVAAAHAAAKAEKALLTRAESAKARRSAVAKFAGEDPNTDTTAALVKSTETVTTMTLAGCRPRRCRRRAFMTLLPAIVSPAGSLTRFRIEKAEELATPSSEAQAVRSCTPSEGAVTKDKREPPGTEMAKFTLVADGASRGEADGDAVGVREGVGVCDCDSVSDGDVEIVSDTVDVGVIDDVGVGNSGVDVKKGVSDGVDDGLNVAVVVAEPGNWTHSVIWIPPAVPGYPWLLASGLPDPAPVS